MKYLSICIPNYNRLDKLKRLIETCALQIKESSLNGEVEICISDDCSPQDPSEMIMFMQKQYPEISFTYVRNEKNEGMDYNFLNSVLISDSLYCWIIGNDDSPEEKGICQVVNYLKSKEEQVDILITPFNIYDDYDSYDNYRSTVYPFGNTVDKTLYYNTKNLDEYHSFIRKVQHNSGLFGFLSNVIFKKQNWEKNKNRFQDKLNTIFIQMYMNIQTLQDGAVVEYIPLKIIRNYADDETNNLIDRVCKILFGLDGVVEYFFKDNERKHLKQVLVDAYISDIVWQLPEEHIYKKKVRELVSGKNAFYQKYFVSVPERSTFFRNKKVFIYGAGNFGKKAYEELKQHGAIIEGIADSNEDKRGTKFEEYLIASVEEMVQAYKKDSFYVVVCSHLGLEEMIHTLIKNKVEHISIIT